MIEMLEDDVHGASCWLDARGLTCPEPVMLLHKQVRSVAAGEVIKVVATDASTERDIPRFCEFLRHPLLESRREGEFYVYWIRVRQEGQAWSDASGPAS